MSRKGLETWWRESRHWRQLWVDKLVIRRFRAQSLDDRLFYDSHFTCLFDLNFNLQPLIPSPRSHCPHITHTHTEARLHSHPLAFSPDSQVDFYLMTLPMPFSLWEALLFPFIYKFSWSLNSSITLTFFSLSWPWSRLEVSPLLP